MGLDLRSATVDNSIAGSFPVSVLPDLPSRCHHQETESSGCRKSVDTRFKLNQSPSKCRHAKPLMCARLQSASVVAHIRELHTCAPSLNLGSNVSGLLCVALCCWDVSLFCFNGDCF